MKKILTLLLFTLFSFVANAQQTIPDTTISNAERIIDKYSDKIANTFIAGIEKITPAAINGFEVVVKLQIAKGIANLLPLLLFIICCFIFNKEYNKINNILCGKREDVPDHMDARCGPFDSDNVTVILILSLLGMILMGMGTLACTGDAITHLIAPEWFAIKEIIELFK